MEEFRAGFVGIVGRANAGKSTLINSFARRKNSVVNERPRRNRRTVKCILNRPQAQIVLVDIPSFHVVKDASGKDHNREARKSLQEVDVVLFLVDATQVIGSEDGYIARELQRLKTPALLALNKADKITDSELEAQIEVGKHLGNFIKIIPISALREEGLEVLLRDIEDQLPRRAKLYTDSSL